MRNEAVLNYFGSKVSSAHKYPRPLYPTIVEPFCGGAGYSLLYRRERHAALNDLSEHIFAAWDYVVRATPEEILALPLIEPGQHVDELGLTGGSKALVRMCVQFAAGPRNVLSPFALAAIRRSCVWSAARRARIARIASEIKHWIVTNASYEDLPNIEATWFVDPPYQGPAGSTYPHGSKSIDYDHLGNWCRSRRGQVIVCENAGANWLPFNHVIENRPSTVKDNGKARRRLEVMWTNTEA